VKYRIENKNGLSERSCDTTRYIVT